MTHVRLTVARVAVVIESTLKPRIFPAVTLVVQPVRVASSDFVALLTVGLALAVIVSATVGG